MSMHAAIYSTDMEPLTDGSDFNEGDNSVFEALETQASGLAAIGTKCCIRWSRGSDGQVAYWGPAGATLKPHWYAKHGGAGRGQGAKAADGATGLKRRNISIDDESADVLRQFGGGDLSVGIRKAARTIKAM